MTSISELVPIGANRFLLQDSVQFEFIPATKEWHYGEGRVLQPVAFMPSAEDMQSYVGDYHSEELATTYTLEAHGAALIVRKGRSRIPIMPFAKDVFVGDDVGIVKFSRDSRRAVTGFTLNRDNVRGVRFDRTK